MKLPAYAEIVGRLTAVDCKEDYIRLVFALDKEIEIPSGVISIEKLRALQGERIGVFNCDGEYKIRRLQSH